MEVITIMNLILKLRDVGTFISLKGNMSLERAIEEEEEEIEVG